MIADKVLERIQKIQNSSRNIGWGVSNFTPMLRSDRLPQIHEQWVIVVGHNIYHHVKTMILEVLSDGKYNLSLADNFDSGKFIAENVDEDGLISALCGSLKNWFPEIRC